MNGSIRIQAGKSSKYRTLTILSFSIRATHSESPDFSGSVKVNVLVSISRAASGSMSVLISILTSSFTFVFFKSFFAVFIVLSFDRNDVVLDLGVER